MSTTPSLSSVLAGGEQPADPERPVLQAQALALRFGGTQALSDVSFHVNVNELFAVLGPN